MLEKKKNMRINPSPFSTKDTIHIEVLDNKPLDIHNRTFKRLFVINASLGYPKNELHEYVNTGTVLLAKNGYNKILGFLIYNIEDVNIFHKLMGHPPRFVIGCLAVDPTAQRKGVGRALMSEVTQTAPKNAIFSLDCRPRNEPYYQQFGFKTVGKIHENCFLRYGFASPALHMVRDPNKNKSINEKETKREPLKEDETDFLIYIPLAIRLYNHSSWFYGKSWLAWLFRSHRKESAFGAIAIELTEILENSANKKINSIHLLRAITHNALIVRGPSAAQTQTTTGRYLLNLLNNNLDFVTVKNLLLAQLQKPNTEQLTYNDLKKFALINAGTEKSADFADNISPYYHFYKRFPEQKRSPTNTKSHFKTLAKIGFFICNNYLLSASIHGLHHNDTGAFFNQAAANIFLKEIGNINVGILAGIGIDVMYLMSIVEYAKQHYRSKEVENYSTYNLLKGYFLPSY